MWPELIKLYCLSSCKCMYMYMYATDNTFFVEMLTVDHNITNEKYKSKLRNWVHVFCWHLGGFIVTGLDEGCLDSLAYDSLISTTQLQNYIRLVRINCLGVVESMQCCNICSRHTVCSYLYMYMYSLLCTCMYMYLHVMYMYSSRIAGLFAVHSLICFNRVFVVCFQIEQYKSVIFYGCVGAGKTYICRKLAQFIQVSVFLAWRTSGLLVNCICRMHYFSQSCCSWLV